MKIEELDRVRRAEDLLTQHIETLRNLRESLSGNKMPSATWMVLRYTEMIREMNRKRDSVRWERDRIELGMKGEKKNESGIKVKDPVQ